jgi:hypothetical protein
MLGETKVMNWIKGVFGAAVALASAQAAAQDNRDARPRRAEVAVGVLAHGIRKPFRSAPPPGFDLYEGEEERGTADLQLAVRSAPLPFALGPRLTAKLQLNTDGRTNFASLGAVWRQHILGGRVYGQVGIGLTLHDGYRYTPDPFAPGLSFREAERRYAIYSSRTAFGSRVLFNPNLALGVKLNDRFAIEAAFEHFSHRELFSDQNPGLNSVGIRLVHALGGQ